MKMKEIKGGVTAAQGFTASGIYCGIRKNREKKDLALIKSEVMCSAAAVYTTNKVKGAPIAVTKENIADGKAIAAICNSGNANTCNADGVEVAKITCKALADELKVSEKDIIIASTGVIGQPLNVKAITDGIPKLVSELSVKGGEDASWAILTTDLKPKEAAVEFTVGGKTCRMGGIAKGSGMINPNMATMLVFITGDVAVSPEMIKVAVKEAADESFNMISVDGDTSTNDMLSVMTNGLAGNAEITEKNDDYKVFLEGLTFLCKKLSQMIARDGEGATKLLEGYVYNAPDKETARIAAKSVISSNLTKAAMFGADANWGRVLCALGYAKCELDVTKIDIAFRSEAGEITVCKNGAGVDFSEEKAKEILLKDHIIIDINLNDGTEEATAFGCDLTYEYVRINGDYRT